MVKTLFLNDLRRLRFSRLQTFLLALPLILIYVIRPALSKGFPMSLEVYMVGNTFGIMFYFYFLFVIEFIARERASGVFEVLLASPVGPVDLWMGRTLSIFTVSYVFMLALHLTLFSVYYVATRCLPVVSKHVLIAGLIVIPLASMGFLSLSVLVTLMFKNPYFIGYLLMMASSFFMMFWPSLNAASQLYFALTVAALCLIIGAVIAVLTPKSKLCY